MKTLLFLIFVITNLQLHAQTVGIGTTSPNANAMLDVSATNKGLLVPRVDLVALTANSLSSFGISATPITSLLVYNTTASTLPSTVFQTGFYYWDATGNWTKLNTGATSSAATGWGLAGNSGTTSINFIGTTDDNDIFFKRNNTHSGRINSAAGNTSFGLGALLIGTTGAANTAFGAYNLQTNTSGYGNTAVGTYGLATNSQGFNNSALGYNALINNSIGNENTSIGKDALFSNTTGNNNTSIGANAQNNNTIGYSNVAIGKSALYKNTGSNNNVAIGDSASFFYLDGVVPHPIFGFNPSGKNTAVGSKALFAGIFGRENTAIGFESMKLADGYLNTGVGSSALFNTTGQSNVGLGAGALFDNLGGQRNSAFGTYSLSTNTTGSYNTGIGFQTQTNGVGLVNATAIGALARVDCSNCLVLGSKNTINGATSDVNVGIGITSPSVRLDVGGTGRFASSKLTTQGALFGSLTTGGSLVLRNTNDTLFTIMDGSKIQAQVPIDNGIFGFGIAGSNLQLNPYGGPIAVGLNDVAPNARLHIAKPPGGTLGGQVPSALQINGTTYNTLFGYGSGETVFINGGKSGSVVNINDQSNGDVILANAGGNVGVSVSSPSAKLDILNASTISDPHIRITEFNSNQYARLEFKNTSGNNFWHIAGFNNNTNTNERLNFFNSTYGDVLSLTGDGKVGIGTTTPEEKLTIITGSNSNGITHSDGTIKLTTYVGGVLNGAYFGTPTNHPLSFYTNNASAQVTLLQNGNFGIGITNPAEKLSVNGRIRSKEVLVQSINWPDFVFDEKYELPPLKDVEKYITTNKHLQNIPSAKEIEANGQNLGEVQKNLLQKIEELTLYIIEQNKRIEKLEATQLANTKK